MKKIIILFAPVAIFILTITGVINMHTLKRNFQTLPARSVQYFRETSEQVAASLARRFPSLFGDRY